MLSVEVAEDTVPTGSTLDGPDTCDANIQNDVWFQYTATADGLATIGTCSQSGTNDDSVLAVYDGALCPGPGAACIASSDDACGASGFMSTVDIPVFAGNSYLVQVAGWNGSEGTGTVTITVGGGGGVLGPCAVFDVGDDAIRLPPAGRTERMPDSDSRYTWPMYREYGNRLAYSKRSL